MPAPVLDLLRRLGAALLQAGQPTNEVADTLGDVARAYGVPQMRFWVLPTGVLVGLGSRSDGPGGLASATDFSAVHGPTLRLDQVAAIDQVAREAVAGGLDPVEGRRRVELALVAPPRFGPLPIVVGYAVLTVGFGLVLNPTAQALPAYAGLGLLVGLLRVVADRLPVISDALPVLAATAVTLVVLKVVVPNVGEDPTRMLAPALVSFLPGATLTVATIELASEQVVAGASRLVYGVSKLLLLSFGVLAGSSIAGGVERSDATVEQLGWLAPLVGVLLVGVGYLVSSSAPRRSLHWLLLALYAAYGAQALGTLLVGSQLSGFVGGLVVVPVAQLIARAPGGPPALVTTLPAFWLLVPGALGFSGVSGLAADNPESAAQVVQTLVSLFAIALGVLVGTSFSRNVRQARRSWLEHR